MNDGVRFRRGMKGGWMSFRPIVVLALGGMTLGVVYPWPWIRSEEQSVQRIATVRKLAGPPGCVCVALTVPPLWNEEVSSGQAEAFCVPDTDDRFVSWLKSGTATTSWRITVHRPLWAEPTLHDTTLQTVEGTDARDLHNNKGCTMVP